jgi:hypothetical protein
MRSCRPFSSSPAASERPFPLNAVRFSTEPIGSRGTPHDTPTHLNERRFRYHLDAGNPNVVKSEGLGKSCHWTGPLIKRLLMLVQACQKVGPLNKRTIIGCTVLQTTAMSTL